MSGTKIGGLKSKEKNLARDPDFYKNIGFRGGKLSRGGGFTKDIECDCYAYPFVHKFSQCRGKLGGSIPKRRKAENNGNE